MANKVKTNAQLIADLIINWPKKLRGKVTPQMVIDKFKEKYPERISP